MQKQMLVTAVVVAMGWAVPHVASAEGTEAPSTSSPCELCTSDREVHVGVNLRTDFGARYYRADLGVRIKHWDVTLVVDPLGVIKGDYDFDGILRYVGERWSVWGGGRLSITPIGREAQYTEKALVGVSALLPSVFTDRVRIHSGLELAVNMHAHGAEIMSRWVCVDSFDCREDHFVFGLFARIEYASAI